MIGLVRMAGWGAVVLLAGFAHAENQLTSREKAAGWQLMFDGKSFEGWEDPTAKSPPGQTFQIEDGCLKALPDAHYKEDLFTRETYGDFEMEFDWKISPAGNSGIKYRIQDRVILPAGAGKFEDQVNAALKKRVTERPAEGQEYVVGFEFQLLDNERNPDAKRGKTHQAGALYDIFAPKRDATRPVGEWNHARLVVRGDRVEHWLNGEKVVDGSLNAPQIAANSSGRWGAGAPVWELLVKQPRKRTQISLQNHDSAAWFKNLKIRRLD